MVKIELIGGPRDGDALAFCYDHNFRVGDEVLVPVEEASGLRVESYEITAVFRHGEHNPRLWDEVLIPVRMTSGAQADNAWHRFEVSILNEECVAIWQGTTRL